MSSTSRPTSPTISSVLPSCQSYYFYFHSFQSRLYFDFFLSYHSTYMFGHIFSPYFSGPPRISLPLVTQLPSITINISPSSFSLCHSSVSLSSFFLTGVLFLWKHHLREVLKAVTHCQSLSFSQHVQLQLLLRMKNLHLCFKNIKISSEYIQLDEDAEEQFTIWRYIYIYIYI
jgi:hypothetical protein